MKQKEFNRYCKTLRKELGLELMLEKFVDAYICLERDVFKNDYIMNNIKDNPKRDKKLRMTIRKAFKQIELFFGAYSKDTKVLIKNIKNSKNILEVRLDIERTLEKFIQKEVLNRNEAEKIELEKKLNMSLKSMEKPMFIVLSLLGNNVKWQVALEEIAENIDCDTIRGENAQRLALGMDLLDIEEYKRYQQRIFLNKYIKKNGEIDGIDDNIEILIDNGRKLEKYVDFRENVSKLDKSKKFMKKLIELNRPENAVPMYVWEEMGALYLQKSDIEEKQTKKQNKIEENKDLDKRDRMRIDVDIEKIKDTPANKGKGIEK